MLRLPNLIIVGLTQYLLFFCLLDPLYHESGVNKALTSLQFFLLVLATLLVTLGGYIINDIFDLEIDKINKPEKVWIDKKFSRKQGIGFYWLINATGFLISIFVAHQIGYLHLCLLFPLAAGLLALYSYRLKHVPLTGNIVVSLFCALVAMIVLYAEWDSFLSAAAIEHSFGHTVHNLFFSFAVFAFVTTLAREIVKDVEDLEGDKMKGSKTFPSVYGINRAKNVIQFLMIVLFGLVGLFIWWNVVYLEWALVGYAVLLIFIPVIFVNLKVFKASETSHYKYLSKLIKILMVLGLLYLVLFRFLYHY